jgi:hypothetical protein
MPFHRLNKPLTREAAEAAVRAIEAAMEAGGIWPLPRGDMRPSAAQMAAKQLGIAPTSLHKRLIRAHELFGLSPHGLPLPPKAPTPARSSDTGTSAARAQAGRRLVAQEKEPIDTVKLRRLTDDNARLVAAKADLERRLASLEDHRASILGLASEPLRPRLALPSGAARGAPGGRTIVAHLSDVHRGEVVDLDEMDGFNAYSSAISRARLGRFFARIAGLATEHWSGQKPDEIILCLGGDMLSGNIHLELIETNDAAVPRAVRELAEDLAGGIVMWRRIIGVPIRVYTVPGNHSRLTLKSHAKRRAAHNLDLLVSDFTEAAVKARGIDGVAFYATTSPDAYFSTYAFNWLLTHGDGMGVGGGKGYIGPIAPITKGHRLLIDSSLKAGKLVHYVLSGHYHTTARTPFGWGNGSVVGYGEYAGKVLRADPEPAKQNMLVVHERNGVIAHQEIYLGHPSEGSLYAGPAALVRPQWNEVA